jgi:hypothetical protein
LLGRYIAEERTKSNVTAEGLSRGSRTEDWVLAFEAGELEVTEHLLSAMRVVLEGQQLYLPLVDKVMELQHYPQGDEALRLAESIQRYEPQVTLNQDDNASRPSTVLEALSKDDRFLLLSPLIFGGSLMTLAIRVAEWSESPDGDSNSWLASCIRLIDKVLVPAVLLALVVTALALPQLNEAFDRICARRRTAKRQAEHLEFEDELSAQAVEDLSPFRGWRVESLAGQMIPKWRTNALEGCQRVIFLERIETMVLLGAITSAASALTVAFASWFSWSAVPPALLCLPLLWLRRVVVARADEASAVVTTRIARAFGHYDVAVPALDSLPTA